MHIKLTAKVDITLESTGNIVQATFPEQNAIAIALMDALTACKSDIKDLAISTTGNAPDDPYANTIELSFWISEEAYYELLRKASTRGK